MSPTKRSLLERIFAPAAALGTVAFSCFDKFSGSNLFGDPTQLTLAFGAGAATLSGLTVNVLSSKLWQDHTELQQQSAIAAALLENGAISRHIGHILAALVLDAGTKLKLEATAGLLAKAIPDAWRRLLSRNEGVRRRLEGPEYARDLLSRLARTADVPVLDPEDITLILRTAADTEPDVNEKHVTALADAVAHHFADAVANALTSPHNDADRAFRRALLNFHAETFAAVQESLALAQSTDARLAQLAESFDVFTDSYCANVDGFAEILTQFASDLTRVAAEVTGIRTGVTDMSDDMRRLTALVGRMHDMLERIFRRQTHPPPAGFATQYVELYCQRLVQSFCGWEQVEAPVYAEGDGAPRPHPATIRDIFVAPACSKGREPVHPDTFHRLHNEKKHPAAALFPLLATEEYRRTVLLADPGFGKTTVLQYLIVTLAGRGELPRGAEALEDCIPIPLVVRDIVRFLPDDISQWRSWRRVLEAFRMARGPLDAGGFEPLTAAFAGAAGEAAFRSLLADPRALFLIDGLDEIGNPKRREAFRDALGEGFSKHPKARWILTSRIIGYDDAKVHLDHPKFPLEDATVDEDTAYAGMKYAAAKRGWGSSPAGTASGLGLHHARLLYLAPFDDARQLDYAQRYFEHQTGAEDHKRANELIAEVGRHPGIHAISRVPSLLNLMAILKRRGVPLPDGRAELYSRIAETYLKTIDDARDLQRVGHGQLSHEEALRWLGIVAMFMQMRHAQQQQAGKVKNPSAGEIGASRADLAGWLIPFVQGTRHTAEEAVARVDLFLDYVAARSGLLQYRGENWFGFVHLTFMEYFAACYLQDELDHAAQIKAARDLQGDDFDEAEYLAQHPAGPIRAPATLLPDLAQQPVWHEVLVFLAERHAMTGATAAQQLENLFCRLFPPLFSKSPVPDPAVEEERHRYLLPEPSVALAMRFANDRFLSSGHHERAAAMLRLSSLWYRRLWKAYLGWPQRAGMGRLWHIAPHLLAEPARNSAVLEALRAVAREATGPAPSVRVWGIAPFDGAEGNAEGLLELDLSGCTGLTSVAGLPEGLRCVHFWDCTALTGVEGLREGLELVDFRRCRGITSVAGLPDSLTSLGLYGCTCLTRIQQLPPRLTYLDLMNCGELAEIANLPPSLKDVDLRSTPKLPNATKVKIRALVKKNGGYVIE
jgi:internalin A